MISRTRAAMYIALIVVALLIGCVAALPAVTGSAA